MIEKQVGAANVAARADRADPGRGRLRRAGARVPAGAAGLGHGERRAVHRRRDPDRLLPDRRLVRLRRTRASCPDLVTTAKGIAGGLPLAGVTGRAEIMDAVHAGGLGGTYGGNPIACAAALAAIETMRELDLARGGPAHRARPCADRCTPRRGAPVDRRGTRPRRDDRVELVEPGTHRAGPGRSTARRSPRPATRPGCSC